jgi:hypothetical protein
MKTIKISTWCPIFSGFYNTVWDGESDIEIELEETGTKYEDWDIDYRGYMREVSERFVSVLADKLIKDIPHIKGIEMEGVVSPREYNFTNDSIDITVSVKPPFFKWVRGYLTENAENWSKYLKGHYTSYDGFKSFTPNYAKGWVEATEDYTKLDGHYLGAILQFYCENEDSKNGCTNYNEVKGFFDTVINYHGVYLSSYMTKKETQKV